MTKQYMLSRRFNRPCTHNGLKKIAKPGSQPDTVVQVPVYFEPAKLAQVPDDVDMSGPVAAGFIVEVKPVVEKPPVKPREAEKKKEAPKPREPKEEPRDEPLEVEVGAMKATVDPGEDGKLGTEDDKVKISPKKEKKSRKSRKK